MFVSGWVFIYLWFFLFPFSFFFLSLFFFWCALNVNFHVSLCLQRLRSDATLHDAQQRTQTTLLLEEVLHEVFTSDSELRITSSHVNITMGR